ncbi:hypothetical protein K491DRAFT_674918 [Lophiostoma macrostomum CBS 122681]|uniref:Zinc finger PHD-type domain-containing protein n=1 Tax=Lophiostoma macrostomum CBS 122681 TaxID=1314788 RepID=A0A6A6TJB6_9PLEO|nr:hypothetical protein K491DRAFT_674918 [Lophiostoma macrostomum CBS 122681]
MAGSRKATSMQNVQGNIALYDHLQEKRQPTFLQRNLRRSLQLHQESVDHVASTQGHEHDDRHTFKDCCSPAHVHPWTHETMIERQSNKRSIKLNIRGIRRIRGHVITAKEPSRKKALLYTKEVSISVDVGIQINTSTDNDTREGPIAWDGRVIPVFYGQAYLKGVRTSSGKEMHIHTAQKIVVATKDLSAESDGRRQMSFHINFGDCSNVKDILECMDWRGRAMQPPSSRWVAEWPDIRESQPDGQLFLPLFYFAKGDSMREAKKELPLGLDVTVEYITHPGHSVLAACVQQRKSELSSTRRPTKPTMAAPRMYKVIYSWPNRMETHHNGLKCHHCPALTFKDINELQLHLKGLHPNFEYAPNKESGGDATVIWRMESEIAETKQKKQKNPKASDDEVLVILAPPRPFDAKQYLESGNNSWQLQARMKKAKSGARKTTNSGSGTSRGTGSGTAGEPPLRRRAPEDVLDRPLQSIKKKYPVPDTGGRITFFRAISKRRLNEGEVIEESEEEAEMEWLTYKTDASLNLDESLTKRAKKLMLEWNEAIRREKLQSEYFLGDALIRFTREKKTWIVKERLDREFGRFASELNRHHAITDEILRGCLTIIDTATEAISVERDTRATNTLDQSDNVPIPRLNKGKGKAKLTDWAPPTPRSTDDDGDVEMRDRDSSGPITTSVDEPRCGVCICGREVSAHKGEDIIFCESLVCARQQFHVDCIVNRWTPRERPNLKTGGWYCKTCEEDPEIEKEGSRWYS